MAKRRDQQIRRLAREGLSVSEIAATLDIPIRRVHHTYSRDVAAELGELDDIEEPAVVRTIRRDPGGHLPSTSIPSASVSLPSLRIKRRNRKRRKAATTPPILSAAEYRSELSKELWKRATARVTASAFAKAEVSIPCFIELGATPAFSEVIAFLRTLPKIEPLPLPTSRNRLGAIAILDVTGDVSLVVECAMNGSACFSFPVGSKSDVREAIASRFELRFACSP